LLIQIYSRFLETAMNSHLKKYRNSLSVSSKEVAEYLSMSPSAYSALECGETKLDIQRATQLSKLYSIKIDELVNPPLQILDIVENFYTAEITDIKNDLREIKESLTHIKNKLNI